MNDTIFNSRQEQILRLLKEKGSLSRSELSRLIVSKNKTSRVTIIRDLDRLIKSGFVVIQGRGRAIRYGLVKINPLLEYVDLGRYFKLVQKEGGTRPVFNSDIYLHLSSLYSKEEISLW